MTRIRVDAVIPAPPAAVWADVRDLASHVEWMQDAEEIVFTSPTTEGVGTSFTCLTRVGPVRLTDRMTVTEWDEGRAIGIRHEGVVTGTGRFTLRRRGVRSTRFRWEERLQFPWWMGGPIGGLVGRRVLRRLWENNLATLAARFR